jgi:Mor family transcriptional regulator
MIKELIRKVGDGDPSCFMDDAPESLREIYSSMIISLRASSLWSVDNIRHLFCCVALMSVHSGGRNVYIPYIKSIDERHAFSKAISDLISSGNECNADALRLSLKSCCMGKYAGKDLKWHEDLSGLINVVIGYMADPVINLNHEVAKLLIALIVECLINTGSGRVFYFPAAKSLISSLRRNAVWQEWRSSAKSNVSDLASRYGVSVPQAYAYIKAAREQSRCQG